MGKERPLSFSSHFSVSLPEMDEHNGDPSEINSFQLKGALNSRVFYLNKKRKLQVEQLGLPISKHKCWDHRLPLETSTIYEENQEEKDLITHIIEENAEIRAIDEGSDPESVKDSNSFVGDSESVYGEAKFEMEVSMIGLPDRSSTSSFNWDNSLRDTQYSSDNAAAPRHAGKEKLAFVEGEHDHCCRYDGLQVTQNLEEPILEIESPLEYFCSEFGTDNIDPCTDKEVGDILYSNGVNPNAYVLSSGRWAVNQDAQSGPRKPTIDREFEQYFSMLML
ncbi:unnamed protein product [Dovyalis caffra]|uniref:Uncharacterized protein n=1 Tax=Dovyalis caffra TaxID=77055 RepID=A0AAV1S245_9ROSI|nr:unnamed protein product [Dovyalis caffra]